MAHRRLRVDQLALQANSPYLDSFEKEYVPFIEHYPDTKFVFVQWLDW